VTEAEARAALRAFVGVGEVEPWIAGRPWQAAPGGWTVPGGVRVIASAGGGEPAVWFVPAG
jgi:hypothetical protein